MSRDTTALMPWHAAFADRFVLPDITSAVAEIIRGDGKPKPFSFPKKQYRQVIETSLAHH